MEANNGGIGKVGKRGNLAYVWLGFSLDNSDFAIHPAFPIFFKNVINWAIVESHSSDEHKLVNFFDEKESNIAPIEADSKPLQIHPAKWYQDLPLENVAVIIAVVLLMTEWILYYKGAI